MSASLHKAADAQSQVRMSLLLPAAVAEPFTYAHREVLPPGTLVEATLANKARIGAVWDDAPDLAVPEAKLKWVQRVLDLPPLPASYRRFIDWVAEFTLAPRGAVLGLAGLAFAGKVPKRAWRAPDYAPNLPVLSADQQAAAMALAGAGTQPVLLDGVTGSGKTEVYFHAIAEALKGTVRSAASREAAGVSVGEGDATSPSKQVLVLLPEIALTHQWLERFKAAFGSEPALWHSQQTPVARARVWQAVARGEAKVVVGARSALFLPFADLALIVVDEEHDPSYKQEDGVLYHARDMAVVRAQLEGCPVVLVSATPALETLENVREGKYRALHLPSRFGEAVLPSVQLIDMVAEPPERGSFLSPLLKRALIENLEKREQSLLFLNRRGYAPLLLCRGCGHRFQCPDCSAWLVIHGGRRLECHHCGHKEPMPSACPQCQAGPEKLAPCGPGIERIAEEVRGMFGISSAVIPADAPGSLATPGSDPGVARANRDDSPRIAVLSSDEAIDGGTWAAIERGEIDILVGTQMVAKGHHFPNLTLVGVVDADLGLDGADLRAAERSYQLLHQLGGRAGRGEKPGRVLVQTYQPNHPVMQALAHHDRDGVMAQEVAMRREGGWPPFGQLAAILLDGVDAAKVLAAGQALARSAPVDDRMRVLGPAPAPLSKLRGQYRFRLLVKATKGIHLQKTLRNWLKDQRFSGVRIKLDVNPYYFL